MSTSSFGMFAAGLRFMMAGRATRSASSSSSKDPESDVLEPSEPVADDCSICLNPLREGVVRTPCGHYFHGDCLDQCFLVSRQPGVHPRCPLCRRSVRAPMPVEARALSGRPIEVRHVSRGPAPKLAHCHTVAHLARRLARRRL